MLVCTKAKNKILEMSNNQTLEVKIREKELEVVNKPKYLGAQIDKNLDWKYHVSSKISNEIGLSKNARSFLSHTAIKSLCASVIELHFRYCCSVWGYAGITEINLLIKLQNRLLGLLQVVLSINPANQ